MAESGLTRERNMTRCRRPGAGLIALPVILAGLALARPAAAKDMNGKFGVGYTQSLGGVSGLNLRYFVGDVQVEGTVGFDLFQPSKSAVDLGTWTSVKGSVGALYYFARSDQANLGTGLRVDLGWRSREAVGGEAAGECAAGDGNEACQRDAMARASSAWQVNIEVPLQAEFFFTDHFALGLATGLLFTIITQEGQAPLATGTKSLAADTKKKGFGFSLGSGSLFGTASFTYYF